MKSETTLDLIVIGGGINGAGIAADASGRGLSVGLYEAHDFASATSSASSKLIHGGLRYLEHYEFRLVAESLAEREVLLQKAPHIVAPLRFRLPHRPHLRPAWMIRCGLFLYDHLGKRSTLPASKRIDLAATGLFQADIKTGFEYSDCWVDDARLTLLNAIDAKKKGAEVRNYCRVERAQCCDGIWVVTLYDHLTQTRFKRRSRLLVNAAGPWVNELYTQALPLESPRNIKLVKGSHIVVPRLHSGSEAYILQNSDDRIVFVIPYLDRFSIVGTTDMEYRGDPRMVAISSNEIQYLIDVVNEHFVHSLKQEDVIWTYSGVRPLCDDESDSPQAITRDYTLELQQERGQPPLLSVFGGKLTTYRKLAEAAMEKLAPFVATIGPAWTKTEPLPGGDLDITPDQLAEQLCSVHSWLKPSLAKRYVSQFGSAVNTLLAEVRNEGDMGTRFASDVYQRELDYMIECEFAQSGEDVLWRRTKLGLYLSEKEQQRVDSYLSSQTALSAKQHSATG